MKVATALLLSFVLACSCAPPSYGEPRQLAAGTELHLTLLTPINSAIAKPGDPIIAVANAPVMLNNQTIVPAGTREHLHQLDRRPEESIEP